MSQTNELYTTIALAVIAILTIIYVLRLIVIVAANRPDITALLSGTAIIIGGFMLSEPAQVRNGLLTMAAGATFLGMSAMNYRHYQGGK